MLPVIVIKRNEVSTHSRTEAAAMPTNSANVMLAGFNTQPHGGGCLIHHYQYDLDQ